MVQYHALTLLGDIKKKDIKYLRKTLSSMTKDNLSGLAAIQHLRMINLVMVDSDFDSPEVK